MSRGLDILIFCDILLQIRWFFFIYYKTNALPTTEPIIGQINNVLMMTTKYTV